ncbi:MAG: TetR/AcrR family transcriptional regulator [Rhizobium sp.]
MTKPGDPARIKLRKKPQQERSIQRLDAILEAATDLIVERGIVDMRMTDLAARAGVPIGSLYQFFPEKAAVVRAIFDRRTQATRARLTELFAAVSSIEEMLEAIFHTIDWHFAVYRQDPVWTALWAASMIDRDLMELQRKHSEGLAAIFRAAAAPLITQGTAERMEARSILFMHLSGAMLRLAAQHDEKTALQMLDEWKSVIREHLFK